MPSPSQTPQARYPYDGRTHTYSSPSGMSYPAPSGSYGSHQPVFAQPSNGITPHGYTVPMSTVDVRQYVFDHRYVGPLTYGPGDWQPDTRTSLGVRPVLQHPLAGAHTHGQSAPATPYATYPSSHTGYARPSGDLLSSHLASPSHLNPIIDYGPTTPSRNLSPLSFRSERSSSASHREQRGQGKERSRIGPPPKAVLGGVGGKTWDEMQSRGRSVTEPLPTGSTPAGASQGRVEHSHSEPSPSRQPVAEEPIGPSYKGNLITFRLPSQRYSPPGSPVLHLRSDEKAEVKDTSEAQSTATRVSRKEAFPWPARPPRGPPATIPLPLSPTDTSMAGRRRTMASGVITRFRLDDSSRTVIEGRENQVVIPDPSAWEKLRAEGEARKRKAEIAKAVLAKKEVPQLPDEEAMDQARLPLAQKEDRIDQQSTTPVDQVKDRAKTETGTRALEWDDNWSPSELNKSTGRELAQLPAPTATRRTAGFRLGENAFVMRQLGGAFKKRSRQGDDGLQDPITITKSRSPPIETAATQSKGVSVTNETQQDGLLAGAGTSIHKAPEADSGGMLESPEVTDPASKLDPEFKSSETTPDDESRTMVDSRVDSDRKSRIKLRNFDDFLGRQLSGTGLLSRPALPTAPGHRDETDSAGPTEGAASPAELVAGRRASEVLPPAPATPVSKKRARSDPDIPLISTSASTEGNKSPSRQYSRLRATATSFQPRAAVFEFVPEGRTTFDFTSPSQRPAYHRKNSSSRGSTSLRGDAAPFTPKKLNNVDTPFVFGQTHHIATSSNEGLASLDVAQKTPGRPLGVDDDGDSDGDRAIRDLDEQSESEQATPMGSPAAEIHGIYASTPTGSMLDEDLFYRPPRSDISDIAADEMEHFDPISYSLDPSASAAFDAADFRTSTPRRDRHLLPAQFSSSPEAEPPAKPSPSIVIDPPAADDRQKFRDWVFPTPGTYGGHGYRPSITRRHTFDTQPGDPDSTQQAGVASTFASRVDDLRAFFATTVRADHLRTASAQGHGLHSNNSSVEFPMRSPTKTLGVVNGSMNVSAIDPVDGIESPPTGSIVHRLGEIKDALDTLKGTVQTLLQGQQAGREEHEDGLLDQLNLVLEKLDTIPPPASIDMSIVTGPLEQQSTLISALASQLQTDRAHSSDHLTPLLEGQQAIMDRFDGIDDHHETAANELERLNGVIASRNADEVEALQNQLAQERHETATERQTSAQLRWAWTSQDAQRQDEQAELQQKTEELSQVKADLTTVRHELVQQQARATAEFTALKHKHELEIANLNANNERLRLSLLQAQNMLQAEGKRNDSAEEVNKEVTAALNALREAIASDGTRLSTQVASIQSRLDDGKPRLVNGSTQVMDSDEVLKLRDEVGRLREKDQSHQIDLERHRAEAEKLQLLLVNERDSRVTAQEQLAKVERWYREEINHRVHADATARERTYVAQLQEARISTMLQDIHHWRSFALAHNPDAAAQLRRSEPFRGFYSADLTQNDKKSGDERPESERHGSCGDKGKAKETDDAAAPSLAARSSASPATGSGGGMLKDPILLLPPAQTR